MTWKDAAKSIDMLYKANAVLKCRQLKIANYFTHRRYELLARKSGLVYSEKVAVDQFKSRLRSLCPEFRPVQRGELNIFWVGACQSQDESGFLQSLRRMGKVTVFFNSEGAYGPRHLGVGASVTAVRSFNDAALIDAVTKATATKRPNILIGQMWAHLYSAEALQEVRRLGIPVVNIAMDDRLPQHWGTRNRVRMGVVGLAPNVDMVLTTTPEACAWYGVEEMPAIFWPLASDPDLFHSPDFDARDISVLFIGNRYGIRGELVQYLTRRGLRVDCYGNGWPNGYVSAEQNCALSKRARIILGVGTVGHCRDVFTLKLRDFDALMSGALYITHRNPDLLSLFSEGQELECYERPEEAYVKICHYLRNPAELRRVGEAGQVAARTRHSWDARLAKTFSMLGFLAESPDTTLLDPAAP